MSSEKMKLYDDYKMDRIDRESYKAESGKDRQTAGGNQTKDSRV